MDILISYGLLGAFAGTMAGLLGVGGGLIIVPMLILLWSSSGISGESIASVYVVQLAIGTSLATIVFTSVSSVWAHHRKGAVEWSIFWKMVPGIIVGAWFGASFAVYLPGDVLKKIFGVFELLIAAQMVLATASGSHRSLPGNVGIGLVSGIIGSASAIIGIGGGILTVPFLTWCDVRIKQAIATSAACGLPIAIGGALSYMILGWDSTGLPAEAAGYVYGPALVGIIVTSMLFAPLGATLAHRLSGVFLTRVFAAFLALLGLWMLAA